MQASELRCDFWQTVYDGQAWLVCTRLLASSLPFLWSALTPSIAEHAHEGA